MIGRDGSITRVHHSEMPSEQPSSIEAGTEVAKEASVKVTQAAPTNGSLPEGFFEIKDEKKEKKGKGDTKGKTDLTSVRNSRFTKLTI